MLGSCPSNLLVLCSRSQLAPRHTAPGKWMAPGTRPPGTRTAPRYMDGPQVHGRPAGTRTARRYTAPRYTAPGTQPQVHGPRVRGLCRTRLGQRHQLRAENGVSTAGDVYVWQLVAVATTILMVDATNGHGCPLLPGRRGGDSVGRDLSRACGMTMVCWCWVPDSHGLRQRTHGRRGRG